METTRISFIKPEDSPPPVGCTTTPYLNVCFYDHCQIQLASGRVVRSGAELYDAGFTVTRLGNINGDEMVRITGPHGRWLKISGGAFGFHWKYYVFGENNPLPPLR